MGASQSIPPHAAGEAGLPWIDGCMCMCSDARDFEAASRGQHDGAHGPRRAFEADSGRGRQPAPWRPSYVETIGEAASGSLVSSAAGSPVPPDTRATSLARQQSFAQLSLSRAQINATTKKIEALEAQKKELTRKGQDAKPALKAQLIEHIRKLNSQQQKLREEIQATQVQANEARGVLHKHGSAKFAATKV
eukprot:Tamp_20906.p2 GENE.Tamp_20906~~Tamp_20906.p2  ORF type:complete len:192 (-),score=35.92 Tamp_20906:464-1039(-)